MLQKTWVIAALMSLSACAFPPSKTLLPSDVGVTETRGVVLAVQIKTQEPLPIDLSATTVPVTSDSTAGIELIRGVWGALDGTSRHRVYAEVRYQDDGLKEGVVDLPVTAKQKYQPGDKIQILHKEGQRTVVNLSQRARLGLVGPHGR